MIVREIKLQLTYKQEATLNMWLFRLTSVYNWGLRQIELNAQNKIYFNKQKFQNKLAGISNKINVPSHVIQGTLAQVWTAWDRCFKKIGGKPKLKSKRRKFRSIPFPDPIKAPIGNRIKILSIGSVKFYKQELPDGKIKCGRIIKRATGWYLCLSIDTKHKFPVKNTDEAVGIDFGFSTLATMSNGDKINNPRELRKVGLRLAQAQRGYNRKLVSRIQEHQARRRQDRNHKISRSIISRYKTIYYSDDNLKEMAKQMGKSVSEAAIGQLIAMMTYKAVNTGREIIAVDNFNSTRRCSNCGSLTGPSGKNGLKVREWECMTCGVCHDRDINAAMNTLLLGSGHDHEASREADGNGNAVMETAAFKQTLLELAQCQSFNLNRASVSAVKRKLT